MALKTASVVSYQSFGDLVRWNPHYHCDRQDVGNVDRAMEGESRPLICPKCGHELKVIAVITEPHEVRKILECLKRNHDPPFDKVVTKAS